MRLLAARSRLDILIELKRREQSVGQLADAVLVSFSAVSQHLAKLKGHGLVQSRRDQQTIFYRLADPLHPLVEKALELAGGAA